MTLDLKQDKKKASRTTTIGDGNSITRCKLSNCAVTSSWLKRCDFTDCALVHVRSAKRTQASKCHLHDVFSVKSSEMTDSAITGRSSIQRSSIKSSTIQNATRVSRSTVAQSVIQKGDLWRASVTDCFIEECVIYRSDFKNVVLKYGVWKRGKLVGRTGDREPVFISKDGVETPVIGPSAAASFPILAEMDDKPDAITYENDYDHDSDSGSDAVDSDYEPDMPPPYKV